MYRYLLCGKSIVFVYFLIKIILVNKATKQHLRPSENKFCKQALRKLVRNTSMRVALLVIRR